jgi:thioredoxin
MTVEILCFHQDGCPGCEEQRTINHEMEETLGITVTDIDAVKTEGAIQKYALHVTPTILVLVNGTEKERMEGITPGPVLEKKKTKKIYRIISGCHTPGGFSAHMPSIPLFSSSIRFAV